jgi:hypothetical protein
MWVIMVNQILLIFRVGAATLGKLAPRLNGSRFPLTGHCPLAIVHCTPLAVSRLHPPASKSK